MKISRIIVQLLFGLTWPILAFADSSVVITVENKSQQRFEFDHAEVAYVGNRLTIDLKIWEPGQTAIITGSTTAVTGLSGKLFFKGGAEFWVEDRLKYHFGQPIFSMHAKGINSRVKKQVFNREGDGRSLSYSAAWVFLTDSK